MYVVFNSHVHVAQSPPTDTTMLWVQATPLSSKALSECLETPVKHQLYINSNDLALTLKNIGADTTCYALIEYELSSDNVDIRYYDESSSDWVTLDIPSFILADGSILITSDNYNFNVKET